MKPAAIMGCFAGAAMLSVAPPGVAQSILASPFGKVEPAAKPDKPPGQPTKGGDGMVVAEWNQKTEDSLPADAQASGFGNPPYYKQSFTPQVSGVVTSIGARVTCTGPSTWQPYLDGVVRFSLHRQRDGAPILVNALPADQFTHLCKRPGKATAWAYADMTFAQTEIFAGETLYLTIHREGGTPGTKWLGWSDTYLFGEQGHRGGSMIAGAAPNPHYDFLFEVKVRLPQ